MANEKIGDMVLLDVLQIQSCYAYYPTGTMYTGHSVRCDGLQIQQFLRSSNADGIHSNLAENCDVKHSSDEDRSLFTALFSRMQDRYGGQGDRCNDS